MTLGQYLGAGNGVTKGLYHLEDVNDSSGSGNTLTNTGTVTFTSGKFNNGANFGTSNTTKNLSVATNMGIDGTAITMMGWINLSSLPGTGIGNTVFGLGSATSKVLYLLQIVNTAGVYSFYGGRFGKGGSAGTNGIVNPVNPVPTTGVWYHYALTYDNTNVTVYLNGSSLGSAVANGNGVSALSSYFAICYRPDLGGQWSSGVADEVIVENVAWSAERIRKHYTYGKGRFGIV